MPPSSNDDALTEGGDSIAVKGDGFRSDVAAAGVDGQGSVKEDRAEGQLSGSSGSVLQAAWSMLGDAVTFYSGFWFYYSGGRLYNDGTSSAGGVKLLMGDHMIQTRVHLYSLALVFFLFDKKHYRCKSFQTDILANLSNVAIPGTGVPLSIFCHSKITIFMLILLVYPICALLGAVWIGRFRPSDVATHFKEHLLAPQDWFFFWRLNSRLVAYHELMTKEEQYKYEDKWDFLVQAEAAGIPVSPFLKHNLIVKHRNEEGGLGLQCYGNAAKGGDWIIQERLENSDALGHLLPPNAPLSTFRVLTASRAALPGAKDGPSIEALSCVFRAGRTNAVTDHVAVQFDVDVETGRFLHCRSNMHWYQRGLTKPLTCLWTDPMFRTAHPDNNVTYTGQPVPEFEQIMAVAKQGHSLCPNVPVAGWDVALTDKGMCLLEVNFSCNFFQATFDKPKYFRFMHDFYEHCDRIRRGDPVDE